MAGMDRLTGQLVRLFHPREDQWRDHFEWAGAELIGRTVIGRATVDVLAINHPHAIAVRESLIREDLKRDL